MRPTFLGFETMRKGIMVTQKGLDITGNNMANVGTDGYTRQRVDQYSVAPDSYRTRYAGNRSGAAGQGVDIRGVSQTRDAFLDKRFRDEYGDVGYYDQKTAIIGEIEAAIDEYNETGLTDALKQINNSLHNFASHADSETHANIVATAFKNITQVLHQYSINLDKVADQQKYSLGIATDDVNTILERVAALNKVIADDINGANADASGSTKYGPNELMDERNLLLDKLSRYGDLKVIENPNGMVTLKMNGHTAVDGQKADNINYSKNENGTVSLIWQSDGKNVALTTGALKATVDLINGRGAAASLANEGVERGIPYYKDKLNAFALTLVDKMNHILPESDGNGNPKLVNGKIVYKTLMGARVDDGTGNFISTTDARVTAANITISDTWAKDSTFVMFEKGNTSGTYATEMSKMLTGDKTISFDVGGEIFTGSFEDYVADYSGSYATESTFNSGRLQASSAVADSLLDRRDSISAVAPDEETANMMLYQKSFQAMSRMMTAMDEALDVLINKMGLVGR